MNFFESIYRSRKYLTSKIIINFTQVYDVMLISTLICLGKIYLKYNPLKTKSHIKEKFVQLIPRTHTRKFQCPGSDIYLGSGDRNIRRTLSHFKKPPHILRLTDLCVGFQLKLLRICFKKYIFFRHA